MTKNLVIVESPRKWKTIEKFLWKDYKVVASMWHIRDLPKKDLWIDIDNNFEPVYEINADKKKTVAELKKLAKTHEKVLIATDEDREWENIGWHLTHVLWLDPKKVDRITFHEITKTAILDAVKNPRRINLDLVDRGQARRLLDRLVWYKISPVLWSKIRMWLSAGRVQSVAVKLIVEKEREIKAFKPKESWKVFVELTHKRKKFKVEFKKRDWKVKNFKSKEDVLKFLHILFQDINDLAETKDKKDYINLSIKKDLEFELWNIEKRDAKSSPRPPFTTSTLQQEASRKLWYSVKQTMTVAQKLYEWVDLWAWERTWLITYMRTDSLNLSNQALWEASDMIEKNFWKDYLKIRKYKTKSSGAQEAHEAIRPTSFFRTPESVSKILAPRELRLYKLIWQRALASQMSDRILEKTKYIFSPTNHKNQEWLREWEVIKFDGFMKLYIESSDDENDEDSAWVLPNMDLWQKLIAKDTKAWQSFSRPPARYTEASLVKKLEENGIGRPSTYAPTISTIMDRGYVEKIDKKYLSPTDISFIVNDFLEEYFKEMMDYDFTKSVELEFDEISKWNLAYQSMLQKFWDKTLKKDLDNATKTADKVVQKVGRKCPECGFDLIYKYSKWWKFIGCSNYPECKFIDQPQEQKDELQKLRDKYEWKPCPDGIEWTIVVKTGRYGPFLASSKYPEVKWIWKIKSDKEEALEQILQEKWLLIDEETGEELVVKKSRRWEFLRAKNYPDVKIAKNIPKEVWDELNERLKQKEEN